jgi:leader peptidase (prepilin peptidase)/N-methyltransferase
VGTRRFTVRSAAPEVVGAVGIVLMSAAAAAQLVPVPAALALALSVPAAVVDARTFRLPDIWIATAVTALAMALAVDSAAGGSVALRSIGVGALVMCAPILLLHLMSPTAMGFGDVKLSLVLGAALGTVDWPLALVALALAGLAGTTYGLATGRRTLPFGPFLVFGSLATLLAGDWLLTSLVASGAAS